MEKRREPVDWLGWTMLGILGWGLAYWLIFVPLGGAHPAPDPNANGSGCTQSGCSGE